MDGTKSIFGLRQLSIFVQMSRCNRRSYANVTGRVTGSVSQPTRPLLVPHLPLLICCVCSPIAAEYRIYLNGSVFWFFSISLR